MARSDGVQMGRYWEAETDHEGPAPVKAGCGVSGRRERAARAGSASDYARQSRNRTRQVNVVTLFKKEKEAITLDYNYFVFDA
jgi:hypothetical protein